MFTLNEENRIEHAIKNFIPYGDVLLLDDGSTDRTREIAERLGARYVLRPKTTKFIVENDEMFEFIKQNTTSRWIFWGFCDNLMPKSLIDKLVEISKQDSYKYVQVPIFTYAYGLTRYPVEKGYSPRFFMRDYVDFSDNRIHGMGTFLGKKSEILHLPKRDMYAIRHYGLYNISKFVTGHLNYARIEATERFQDGKKFSAIRMVISMTRYFVLYYKYGYKNGAAGFISALSYAFFRFMMFAQLYELENGITLDSIEEKYRVDKQRLLENLK